MQETDLLRYLILPLESKNPVAAMERVSSLDVPEAARKRFAQKIFDIVLSQPLTNREKAEIEQMVICSKGLFNNKNTILKKLSNKKEDIVYTEDKPNLPGRTQCLFVVGNDQIPFGCIQTITAITINDGKGDHRLIANELSGQVSLSFYTAYEAVRFAMKKYGMNPEGYRILDNYGITVQVGSLKDVHDGTSLCLAVAIAIVSSLTGIPIDKTIAFTGTLTIAGDLEEVSGIREKLRVAAFKGIEKVYLPKKNRSDLDTPKSLNIVPTDDLNDVLKDVFGKERLSLFVDNINRKTKKVSNNNLLSFSNKKRKVLISTVGMRDPYGKTYQNQENSQFTEGPILTAYRRIHPDFILLIPTKETLKNAESTKAEIDRMKKSDICCIRMIEVVDPTDYDALYIAILAAVNGVREMLKDKENFISISSGTPQMHVVLLELLRTGKLLAQPIHVREPMFATSWEDRVKPVKSEYLNIGIQNL